MLKSDNTLNIQVQMNQYFNLYELFRAFYSCYVLLFPLNKFIMKVNRERNPYLKRIFSQQPHKYSYDIDRGKYYLLDEHGKTMNINLNGTFRPKFRANYSGFVDHKSRYNDAKLDPAILHFAPDPQPRTTFYNPMPDKFAGYAQYPYQLKQQCPTYLKKQNAVPQNPRKKAQSLLIVQKQKRQESTNILEYTTNRISERENHTFFGEAWDSMTETKPLPKQKKKTCYNYKCKYLKQWVFDQKGKLQAKKVQTKAIDRTLGRSFHEGALERQMQQSKLISTMALSGFAG